jgi:hypothetical protein
MNREQVSMSSGLQFEHRNAEVSHAANRRGGLSLACACIAFVLACAPSLRAQQAPAGAIGRVDGDEVSVEGGIAGSGARTSPASAQPSGWYVSNGSIVTVHAGQARMALVAGGQIEICGPAKFTVLESGGAITLALNFGRLRAELPSAAALRIFSPTIVATPLDISGAMRDVTVGLDLNDSLCVLAKSGAIRLEQQFSGEGIIVPQSGEFFFAGGKLVPVAGAPGSCGCFETQARAGAPPSPPPPDARTADVTQAQVGAALSTPPRDVPQPQPEKASSEPPVAVAPRIEVGILARANEVHPIPPPSRAAAASAPPLEASDYIVVAQPLVMMAKDPAPPDEPPADVALLVRVARVQPEWEFTGHIAQPEFAVDVQRALGQAAPAPQVQPVSQPAKKKRGFWGALKGIFVGNSETRE